MAHVMRMLDTANSLLYNGGMKTQWISVKDRSPEIGQICIVSGTDGMMISQWGSKDLPFSPGWVFIHAPMYSQGIGFDATHWMPLPQKPIDPQSTSLLAQGDE
jgi:Protein of unknown function (DUF551)